VSTTHTLTATFLRGLAEAGFDFSSGTSDVFKIALYTAMTGLDYTTTVYTTTNEASGTGYTAAGATLTIATNPTVDDRTAYLTFTDPAWTSATFTARGALIYKADGATNPSVAVLDFDSTYGVTAGTFTVDMPTKLIKLMAAV